MRDSLPSVLFLIAFICLIISSLLKWITEDVVMSEKTRKILKKIQYSLMVFALLMLICLIPMS